MKSQESIVNLYKRVLYDRDNADLSDLFNVVHGNMSFGSFLLPPMLKMSAKLHSFFWVGHFWSTRKTGLVF